MLKRLALGMLLVSTQAFLVAPVAPAAESESSVPASVSFLDQRPLTVKVSKLKEAGGLEVRVHNDLDRSQPLTLRIAGLEQSDDPGVSQLFESEEVPSGGPVAPGGTVALKLPLNEAAPAPETPTFEAVLVASGASGGVARRALTIDFAASSTGGEPEAADANVLRPDRVVDLTFVAVNFVPSLLSNLTAIFFFAAALLVLAAVVLFLWRGSVLHQVRLLLIAVAVLLVILATVFLLRSDPWDQPSAAVVSARPVPVSKEVGNGNVGTVAASNGRLGQLVVEEGEIRPKGLRTAGAYSGTYDLTPGVEKGDAKATVNVRDFWPYAVLTIFLGLLTAWALRRWFQRTRPQLDAELQLDRLLADYSRRAGELQDISPDAPYIGLSLSGRFRRLGEDVARKVGQGKADEAVKQIEEMRPYVDKYFLLWESLRSLDQASKELHDLNQRFSGDIPAEDLDLYFATRRMLESALRVTALGQTEETLTTELKEVESQDALVRAVCRDLEAVMRHQALVHTAVDPRGEHQTELREIEKKLTKIGRKVLQASTVEALATLEGEDDEALSEFLALRDKTAQEPHIPNLVINTQAFAREAGPALLSGIWSQPLRGAELQIEDELPEQPKPSDTTSLEIRWARLGDEKFGTGKVYKDDLVEFVFTIQSDGPLPFQQLEVEFEEGQKKVLTIPAGPGVQIVTTTHPYRSGGNRNVKVRALPGGDGLGTAPIEVDAETKVKEGQKQLTENDHAVAAISFALAVASGMVALYLNDPSWGEPLDYMTALLWGGVTGEGVKFATAIADRVFPSS